VPEGPAVDALGARRTVIYSGPRALRAVAVRREIVYVADANDGLLRMEPGAAVFERIAAAMASEFLAGDLNLYWYEAGGVWKASLSATDAMRDPVVANLPGALALRASDQTELYAADETQRSIHTFPIAGGMLTTLASGVTASDLKLRAGFLYYAELGAGHVARLAPEGGAPERLTATASTALQAVESDGSELYWSDGIAIFAAPLDDVADRSAIGVAGPHPQGGRSRVQRMQLGEQRLLWSDRDGNLGWTALDGSECALIAAGVRGLAGWDADEAAFHVAVDMASASELWRITY
jgi:hypothetical protein